MSSITTTPRKKPDIKWNDKSYASWVHVGKSAEDFTGFDFLRSNAIRFFNRVDLNFAPLRQNIQAICRIVQPEFNDDGEKIGNAKKEYVYYSIEYSGKDSWKQRINSGEIVEGRHQIIPQDQQVSWKLEDGQPVEHTTTVDGDPIIKYHTQFSKKAVDEIIKKHGNEDRRDEIQYIVKFNTNPHIGAGGDRCGGYSYDQFVNSEFEHLRYLANRIGGVSGTKNLGKADPAKVQISCNCNDCQKEQQKR